MKKKTIVMITVAAEGQDKQQRIAKQHRIYENQYKF